MTVAHGKLEILVVGSMAFDSLETPAGRVDECTGGSANYFSVSASLFAPVRIVAVVGDDYPPKDLELLKARGVNLDGVEVIEGGRTFRWAGRYGDNLNEAQTLDTQLNVFEQFEPKIPAGHRGLPLVFLGNIAPELQLNVLDQVEAPTLVGADTMNFWITGGREALERVLKRIDLLVINDQEARLLAGRKNIVQAADRIRSMGPKTLIIKRGEYGSLLFHDEGVFAAPAFALREVVDPTGAGDSFAGGLFGSLAESGTTDFAGLKRGMIAGTVMASFTCEGFGLTRLLSLTREVFDARVESLLKAMRL